MSDDHGQDQFVDLHVGQRIRLRRKSIKVSQEALAEILGITYQQVQKYERATNRVSASKLLAIGRALDVPVGFFFEGLEQLTAGRAPVEELSVTQRLLSEKGGLELARAFLRITNDKVRRHLVSLAESLSEPHGELGEPSRSPGV
jgi:transcriptional regulator with XRE-family HTH domain